jgi:Domain of unknown function (DUF4337)
MAAALALTEFAAKDAQTSYLSNHIAASDTWAQYQAKSVRRAVLSSEADVLESQPILLPTLLCKSRWPVCGRAQIACVRKRAQTAWSNYSNGA